MSEPGGWFNCQVVMAGPAEDENIYIRLRERQGTFERWYSAVPRIRREMLATALTAISLGLSVDVNLASTTEYSRINRLYVTIR